MNNAKITFLFAILLISSGLYAQCPNGEREVKVEINTDLYWYEAHWEIRNDATGFLYASGNVPDSAKHVYSYCIPNEGCLRFTMFDDQGDAMTPDGYYKVFLDGVLVKASYGVQYLFSESTVFGCPPGLNCGSAIPVDTGYYATPDGAQTWYKFVPADTGIYVINTCDSLNACGSKIWVYGHCENIVLTETIVGADFYADGGCDNGAKATVYLGGGQEYYIRIRSQPANCDTLPIHFSIRYDGPISGCQDPLACNYEPLATIAAPCIYPGDPNCPQSPDLTVREDVLRGSLAFESADQGDVCYVEEGCIRGLGNRHLIKFVTYISNIGNQDYFIGSPPIDPNTPSDQFVWDLCHHHWHYVGYADYVLFDEQGTRVPIGSKTGFCVLDLVCPPDESKYDCGIMGITAGCSDVYDLSTPCQWIDITGIPAGDYTLVVRVNWDKSPDALGRIEKDFTNNWAQACFTLTYDGALPEVVFHDNNCQPYTDCLGEVFGASQPDCNGVCNGPALFGDINQDTLRDAIDMLQYLGDIVAGTGDASKCFDLDDNGQIDVYDAALEQECALHQNDAQYWYQQFPCQFPSGFNNLNDLVVLKPGTVDTIAKTFDIEINNPFNEIIGFEFSVSGLIIDSVQNLLPGYHPELYFNPANGKIVGLSPDESVIQKNPLPAAFLRVHYSELTDLKVCLESLTAVVNKKYHLSNASIGTPNCIQVKTSATSSPAAGPFQVYVQPNPFTQSTHIFFENESGEPMRVELWDVTGTRVKLFEGVRDNMVVFERQNLPAGPYFFSVRGSKGVAMGKIMAE